MIREFFVLKIGNDFLADYHNIYNKKEGKLYHPMCGWLAADSALERTDRIDNIKLLFNTYQEAEEFKRDLYNLHHLFCITTNPDNALSIVSIQKWIYSRMDDIETPDSLIFK